MDQLNSKNLISNDDNIKSANEKDGKICALSETNEIERCFSRPDEVADNPEFCLNDDLGSNCLESKENVFEEPEKRTSPLSKLLKYFSVMSSSNGNEASNSENDFWFVVQQDRKVLNIRPSGLSLNVSPSSTKPLTLSNIDELESDFSEIHQKKTNIHNHTETPTSTLKDQKEVESCPFNALISNDEYTEEKDGKINEYSGTEKSDSIDKSLINDLHGFNRFNDFSLSQLNRTISPDCLKTFQSNGSDQRYSVPHTDPKRSICNARNKDFTKKRNLNGHVLSKKELKPFKCDKCGKSFIQNISLQSHICSNMGEKTFACKICGKSFIKKRNLVNHMRIHKGDKPFKCETCGKSFTLKTDLKRHSRVHTGERPFFCETCGKSFTLKGNLIKHLRCHTREKPVLCKTCGKSFTQKNHLQRHTFVHTDEKQFTCKDCGKKFKTKGNLQTHKKKHDGK